jgi:TonB family protein
LSPQLKQNLLLKGWTMDLRDASGPVEQASCLLSMWFNGDGDILAVQLLRSSGFPRLDNACFAAVIGQRLKPGDLPEPELGGWVRLPITWALGKKAKSDPPPHVLADPAIPAIRTEDPLDVRPAFYPPAALAERAHGICKMHVGVSAAGIVDSIEVTQSTGSKDLDQACLDVIYDAPFVPAKRDGIFVDGTTEVALLWRLPASTADTLH